MRLRPLARSIYYWSYRQGVLAHCRYMDWRLSRADAGEASPIPPAILRFRVGETTGIGSFVTVGRDTAKAIEAALESIDRPFESFESILDFGCGCGRTLIWFLRGFPGKRLCGSDVDALSIDWCRTHLKSAEFSLNTSLPPMCYPDGAFDLVYGISVFTHLCEDDQLRWLTELHRVVQPGGILVLSVHGEQSWNGLAPEDLESLQRNGLLFKTSSKLSGIVPDWYHTAYHSREYVLGTFCSLFTLLAYVEGGLGNQDLVMLQR